jgi:hypothetical protein
MAVKMNELMLKIVPIVGGRYRGTNATLVDTLPFGMSDSVRLTTWRMYLKFQIYISNGRYIFILAIHSLIIQQMRPAAYPGLYYQLIVTDNDIRMTKSIHHKIPNEVGRR